MSHLPENRARALFYGTIPSDQLPLAPRDIVVRWYEHSGYLTYECPTCRESGDVFFAFESSSEKVLQFEYERELAKTEAEHAVRGCKGRLVFVMARRSRMVAHSKIIPAPRAGWWRRLMCRMFKHVPEDYEISACSPISTGRRCKRCGEKWPQCESCGNAPYEMVVRGSGEKWCRTCVGI